MCQDPITWYTTFYILRYFDTTYHKISVFCMSLSITYIHLVELLLDGLVSCRCGHLQHQLSNKKNKKNCTLKAPDGSKITWFLPNALKIYWLKLTNITNHVHILVNKWRQIIHQNTQWGTSFSWLTAWRKESWPETFWSRLLESTWHMSF